MKLIELEGEDAYGIYDLKTAIDSTNIVIDNQETGIFKTPEPTITPIPVTTNDNAETIEL